MDNAAFEVERVVLRRVEVPFLESFRISNGSVDRKESIVIALHAGEFVGYGEASPMSGPFYSSETPETTWNALANDLIPDLLSRTIQSPVEYADLLNEYKGEPFARAGIEGVVWDLTAKRIHTSIDALLGASSKPIPSGAAIGIFDTIEELLQRIDQYLKEGYQRVKIKIMPGWDVEPLKAIRGRFGDIPLMVDANSAYQWPQHREVLCGLDDFGLMMIEQPLASDALREMGELARTIKTPICADESAESLERLEEIIQYRSASIINIKVQRVGGLWNAKRMLERAREAGLKCWLGTMPELGIASTQALALASLDGFEYPTDIEASARWYIDDIIDPPITIDKEGFIVKPETGYSVDRAKLERYTTHTQEFVR
jgi:O-succinylbenzoate synthase